MTPSSGVVAESLVTVTVTLFTVCLTSLLKGYTNILFLISGDRRMNSKQLIQPWPVMVIACRIEQGQEHVLCHARVYKPCM